MAEIQADRAREAEPSGDLSERDKRLISERTAGSAKVVHEVVRLQGDEELDRPVQSLLFSGFAAGVAICASLMAEAFLRMGLPAAPWTALIVSLGYTVGFVIVILGNLQLFTESTVTAVLPLATHPTGRNLVRLLRLWIAVFVANMAGTFLVAALMAGEVIIGAEQLAAAVEVSRPLLTPRPAVCPPHYRHENNGAEGSSPGEAREGHDRPDTRKSALEFRLLDEDAGRSGGGL